VTDHPPENFALDEAQHELIFRTQICPVYFTDAQTSPNPTIAIILGGQPGAGKSELISPAEKELRASGWTIVINGDDLRSFHPKYEELQRSNPEEAAQLTNLDSGLWVEKLIAEGIARRVNLVIESTLRSPDVFVKTSAALRSQGFAVQVRALAVNERASWQGVHLRYEEMISRGALPRFTLRSAHDAAVTGMLETFEKIECEGLAGRVVIAARGGRVLYDNELLARGWKHPPRAAAVVREERNRPLSENELKTFLRRWDRVIEQMEKRGVEPEKIEAIRQIAKDDLAYFRGLRDNEKSLAQAKARAERFVEASLYAEGLIDKGDGISQPKPEANWRRRAREAKTALENQVGPEKARMLIEEAYTKLSASLVEGCERARAQRPLNRYQTTGAEGYRTRQARSSSLRVRPEGRRIAP
jgi:predicted ABC-type ATPase